MFGIEHYAVVVSLFNVASTLYNKLSVNAEYLHNVYLNNVSTIYSNYALPMGI